MKNWDFFTKESGIVVAAVLIAVSLTSWLVSQLTGLAYHQLNDEKQFVSIEQEHEAIGKRQDTLEKTFATINQNQLLICKKLEILCSVTP